MRPYSDYELTSERFCPKDIWLRARELEIDCNNYYGEGHGHESVEALYGYAADLAVIRGLRETNEPD